MVLAVAVVQSRCVPAPLERVWAVIRKLDFSWHPLVTSAAMEAKSSDALEDVGGIRVVAYK
jgi:hypothetical protein